MRSRAGICPGSARGTNKAVSQEDVQRKKTAYESDDQVVMQSSGTFTNHVAGRRAPQTVTREVSHKTACSERNKSSEDLPF